MKDYQKLLDTYKPLRQIIKKTSIEDSLYVVWSYSQNIQTGNPIPTDVKQHSMYFAKDLMQRGVYQWSLETLAKEVLINADKIQYSERIHQTFRDPNLLMKALGQINKLDDSIALEFLSERNILKEFSRIAFRQFSWQRDVTDHRLLIRYYKIFNQPGVKNLIEDVTGLAFEELFLFSICFTLQFLKNPALSFSLGDDELLKKTIRYIEYFSKDLESLRKDLISEHSIDEQYLYAGAKLRLYPLIRMRYRTNDDSFVCPMPTLFFWRVTSGLYYDIVSHNNFNVPFGKAFEQYVGMILKKVYNGFDFSVIAESKYIVRKSEEDTVDWVLADSKAAIFIECKTKRMTLNSKMHLNNEEYILKDLKTFAANVVKLYKTIKDYESGYYSTLQYDSQRNIYPLMLTLESWFVFHQEYRDKILELIIDGLTTADIKPDILQKMPYSLCCVNEFEEMVQIIKEIGIASFFGPKFSDFDRSDFEIGTYYNEYFGHINTDSLFINEYDQLVNDAKVLLNNFYNKH